MKKDKLDKLVDEVFDQIGELRFNPFEEDWMNKDEYTIFKVIKKGSGDRVLMTYHQIPLILYLKNMLDHTTFISLLEKMSDRFISLYKPELGRSKYIGSSTFYYVFVTYHE